MKKTLRDVAAVAGVSYRTVSNVINGHKYISDATRAKVERAIAEVGYHPNQAARGLRLGKTGAIGLAVPTLRSSYFSELADDVIAAAARRGLVVMIEQTDGDVNRELDVLTGPRRGMTDGLLFIPLAISAQHVADLSITFPLVVLGEPIFDGMVDHVTMDNVEAARRATEHLVMQGRKRILALGATDGAAPVPTGLRLAGYRQALEVAGLPYRRELLHEAGLWQRADGAEAMRRVLAEGIEFDGVFALTDEVAIGAMRVLQEVGFSVPGDVAVIGLDDIDDSQYVSPSLTSVDAGRREIATLAVECLASRVERFDDPGEGQVLRPEVSIAHRESA